MPGPDDLVDLDRYPITDLRLPATDAVVAAASEAFTTRGVAILPGFLRAGAVEALVEEADHLAPLAHESETYGTPYLGAPDWDLPEGHPGRNLQRSRVGAVAYDLFPPDSLLRSLYEWDALKDFVAAVLGVPELHRYADPFGALNLAVMGEGDELGWHFDMTDFVVSIALRSSESGGLFENAARIRSAGDENLDGVRTVLEGAGPPGAVATEPMVPGTLMLFNGRWSMHRVTPIGGPITRLVALLAYDTKPGTDSSELLKLVRYGRLPA